MDNILSAESIRLSLKVNKFTFSKEGKYVKFNILKSLIGLFDKFNSFNVSLKVTCFNGLISLIILLFKFRISSS